MTGAVDAAPARGEHQAASRAGGRTGNLAVAVVLLIVAATVVVQSLAIGEPGRPSDPGAGGYPIILAAVLAGLSLVLAFQRGGGERLPAGRAVGRVAGIVVAVVAYANAMLLTGYVLATAAFVAATAFLMGSRRPLPVAVLAVAVAVGMYYLFYVAFDVSLPRGNVERLIS
ncbi:tripartite tricarboxylate transporter TctB family protein [Georgenia alba]|uniref:Tripartite tricarboxylate transporter TctB family protein n=1 Tax=Georgenia alba TaxID=2233858 RepID=A0ABW2Q8C9_9MICO